MICMVLLLALPQHCGTVLTCCSYCTVLYRTILLLVDQVGTRVDVLLKVFLSCRILGGVLTRSEARALAHNVRHPTSRAKDYTCSRRKGCNKSLCSIVLQRLFFINVH